MMDKVAYPCVRCGKYLPADVFRATILLFESTRYDQSGLDPHWLATRMRENPEMPEAMVKAWLRIQHWASLQDAMYHHDTACIPESDSRW